MRAGVPLGLTLLLTAAPALAGTQHRPWVGISAEERFDSAAIAGGGSELMSKVSPEVGYELRGHGRRLELGYALDLIHHLRDGNLTFDHRVRGEYRDRLTERFSLQARGAFFRVEDMSSLPRFGVAIARAPALWGSGDVGADWRLSRTATLGAGYRMEATRIFLDGYPLGTSHALRGDLTGRLSRRLQLGVRYRGQLFLDDSERFADTLGVFGTARYQLTRHSFAAVEGGPLLYREAGGGETWVPRGNLELGYEARGWLLGLVVGHDVVGAAGYATAVWSDYVQGAATWRWARDWTGYVGGGYYRNGRAPDEAADADGFTASAGVEWRFAPGLAAAATYDHIGQFTSGSSGLGLSRDIVSLRFTYRTPGHRAH